MIGVTYSDIEINMKHLKRQLIFFGVVFLAFMLLDYTGAQNPESDKYKDLVHYEIVALTFDKPDTFVSENDLISPEYSRQFSFRAFSRKFYIAVKYDPKLSGIDVKIHQLNGTYIYKLSSSLLFVGIVKDDPNSYVTGYFSQNGNFKGFIDSKGLYYIEPYVNSSTLLADSLNVTVIIYKGSQVIFPGCVVRDNGTFDCKDIRLEKPKEVKTFANVTDTNSSSTPKTLKNTTSGPDGRIDTGNKTHSSNVSQDNNLSGKYNISESSIVKDKVATVKNLTITVMPTHFDQNAQHLESKQSYDYSNVDIGLDSQKMAAKKVKTKVNKEVETACAIEAVTDPSFYKRHSKNLTDMIAHVSLYIKFADNIFRKTDFDNDGKPDNIRLSIKQMTFYLDEGDFNNPFVRHASTSKHLLRIFAAKHNSSKDFCLSVGFVAHELPNDDLGSAFTPDIQNPNGINSGGICHKNLNIALVTEVYENRTLPLAVTCATTLYEIGTAFGSQHDLGDTKKCAPNPLDDIMRELNPNGQFLVIDYNLKDRKINNDLFSKCIIEHMEQVIKTSGPNCLAYTGHCGNGILELGEECDCGHSDKCDEIDPCCTPLGSSENDPPCSVRRHRGYECSYNMPCCSIECMVIPKEWNYLCGSGDQECDPAVCDGVSPLCPAPKNSTEGMSCQRENEKEHMVCQGGKCNTTLCGTKGMKSCNCAAGSGYECHRCCRTSSGKCVSASAQLSLFFQKFQPYTYPQGTLCQASSPGQCSSNGICLTVLESAASVLQCSAVLLALTILFNLWMNP